MNLFSSIMLILTNQIFLYLVFAIAIFSLLFPQKIIAIRKENPYVYKIIIRSSVILAIILQFPLLYGGFWGLGAKYIDTDIWNIVKASQILLLLLYPALFFISIWMQNKNKTITDISWGIAFFTSLISSPILYFLFVKLLDILL